MPRDEAEDSTMRTSKFTPEQVALALSPCMRQLRGRVILVALAAAAVPRLAISQSCKTADSQSASMLIGLRKLADTTGTEYIVLRSKLQTAAVSAAQVTLVSDDSTCARARQALDSLIHANNPNALNPLPPRALYVMRVGSVTAVRDPAGRAGEYSPILFLDYRWSFLGTMLGY